MTRTGLLLVAGAFAALHPAAFHRADAQVAYANRTVPAPALPPLTTIPLSVPSEPGLKFEPAPMPDADLYPPVPHTDETKSASVTPSLFRPKDQYRGDGFSPGSTVQGNQERLLKPAPGLSMKVPLN